MNVEMRIPFSPAIGAGQRGNRVLSAASARTRAGIGKS